MALSLTIFKSKYDNKTAKKMSFPHFQAFSDLLFDLSGKPAYKPKKDELFSPAASPLISPAMFKEGETRRNVSVTHWGRWAALDVDSYEKPVMEKMVEEFLRYEVVLYSTASSTQEHPKFRVVFSLTDEVPASDIRAFWFSLNKKFSELGDPQTKDLCRMYYIPGQYPGAFNFFMTTAGKGLPRLNPGEVMREFPAPKMSDGITIPIREQLPEHIQKLLAEYRKGKLESSGAKYVWTSWRNCPFVSPELVASYRAITETGWYAMMYKIMVSIASKAFRRGYAITASQIAQLCKEIDRETGGWYQNRPMEVEAQRAIVFALSNVSPPSSTP